jgi:hypothetical protein
MKWDKSARVSTWFYLVGIMFILFAVAAENSSNGSDLQGMIIGIPEENLSLGLNQTLDLNSSLPEEMTGEMTPENITPDNGTIIENISEEIIEENLPIPEDVPLLENISVKTLKILLKNKRGGETGKHNIVEREGKFDLSLSSKKDKVKGGMGIASSEAEARVEIHGLESTSEEIIAVVDDYSGEMPIEGKINTKVFAIEEIQIENATLILPKNGFVNKIFRCNNFDLSGFNCLHWEITDIPFVDHGDTIEFSVTHFSAYAGGEIIAVNAEHLDANYSFISNIYDSVKDKDGIWSEPIYAGEIVRVTYEHNLTDGKTIDIYARSNHTTAYIEVYEAGTNHFVGRSPIIEQEEWQYFQVDNLTRPTDRFDFKIVKVYPDPADDSTDIFADIPSFIEFDYIHDEAINATAANGLVAYGELNIAEPYYRLWNSTSADFGAQLTDAQVIGTGGTDDITWVVTKANHERDEIIVGTEDKGNDINIQVFNSTKQWGNLLEVSASIPNSAYRAFDIAIEDVSGDVLIVYENGTGTDSNIYYRIWNGTGYSTEQTLTTTLAANAIAWVSLIPKRGADNIMLVAHTSTTNDIYAVPWNGTAFDTSRGGALNNATVSNINHFSYAWEEVSGEGILLYGSSTNLVYRTYSPSTGWGAETTVLALGDNLLGTRSCSDPFSNYIGMIVTDAGSDVNVRMWNGSSWLASPPTEDGLTESPGTQNQNVDCAWFNSTTALFGFIDNNDLTMDYFTFSKPSSWSTADLTTVSTTATIAADDIAGLRFTEHPTTSEIMIIEQDILEDVRAVRWTGSAFVIPTTATLEGSTEVLNAAQESAMFDWNRYDPAPAVTNLAPSGTSYASGTVVNITVNVSDNIAVSVVSANITLPNGTISQVTLSNPGGTGYNASFSGTTLAGTYTIRIIANDTSSHQNYNTSVTSTFAITDTTNPGVTGLRPVANTSYNAGEIIEIAANVTDNVAVSSVRANITYPNSTVQQVTLSLATGAKYNTSFTIPALNGRYNLTFIANDTTNNVNSTETTYFIVADTLNPSVTNLRPIANVSYNTSNVIEIAANVSDNVALSTVLANVTYSNGTVQQLTLSLATGSKYNTSFTAPALIGRYNVTIIANDSSNNVNATETTYFNVNDVTSPSVIDLRPVAGTSYNVSSVIEIAANVSDNVAVSTVLANVTYSNGTVQQLTLSLVSGTKYNSSFTIPNLIGRFNVTIIANDSSNNVNATETTYFNVNDVTSPNVIDLLPIANASYNTSNVIEIAANISDNVAVSTVLANVTYSNGTVQQLTLSLVSGTKYNGSFTIPNLIGRFNVTIIANDSSNNVNATETTYFIVNDVTPPSVIDLRPVAGTNYNLSDVIDISANVSDNIDVSVVLANITYPNSTIQQITLINSLGSKYNNTFTVPALIGRYNVTFTANDTFNNVNYTGTTYFMVNDVINPAVVDLRPLSGTNYNVSNSFEIAANVTDDVGISQVKANITYPNSTVQQITLSLAADSKYNSSFTAPNVIGTYTVRIIANDTSNNVNSSETTTFVVNDVVKPSVVDLRPLSGTNYNISNVIEVATNVTDDVTVSMVKANLTYPNSSIQELTLSLATGNKYNTSFTAPALLGQYNLTFFANDTSNNLNTSETTTFGVNDVVVPSVTFVSPLEGNSYPLNTNVTINVTITDQIGVSFVYVNVTLPDTSIIQLNLSGSGTNYNATLTNTSSTGNYLLRIIANDTSNNINNTEYVTIQIKDVTTPIINLISPAHEDLLNYSSVNFSCNVSDNVAVANVTLYTNISGSFAANQTLSASGTSFLATYLITVPDGTYGWNCLGYDEDENSAFATSNRTVRIDTTPPAVTNVVPITNSYANVSTNLNINATITDAYGVASVLANITYPNTTVQQVVLSSVGGNNYNYGFTVPNVIGVYTVRYIATDNAGNINSSVTTNFTATDYVNPRVTSLIPAAVTNYNVSNSFEIAANVTDDVGVSQVKANITYPNSTVQQITLSLAADSKYNSSFTAPNVIGTYTVRIIANDTSNNLNSSETTTFIVNDVVNPIITLTGCLPNPGNQSQSVTCNATATDDVGLSSVVANLTLPNSTVIVQTLSNYGSNYWFTTTSTSLAGTYNITWRANDTSNNIASAAGNFTINDVTAPTLTSIVTTPSLSVHNNGSEQNLSVNLTSSEYPFNATFRVYYSNGTLVYSQGPTLLTSSSSLPLTFTILDNLTGATYLLNLTATDPYSNSNTYALGNFTVDSVLPYASSIISTPTLPLYNNGSSTNISVNFTPSEYPVDLTFNLYNSTGDLVNYSSTVRLNSSANLPRTYILPVLTQENYTLNFTLVDLAGNTNYSNVGVIYVDTTDPIITSLTCQPTNVNLTQNILCNATVTDNLLLNTVWAYVTLPNGTSLSQSLSNITSNYYFNFTNSTLVGRYNVTWYANDSSTNLASNTSSFNVSDVTAPVLTLNSPVNGANISASSVTVNFTATDNYYSTSNCSVYLNGTYNQNNAAVVNGTPTLFTLSGLQNGTYTWNITCTDASNNRGYSETRSFMIDTTFPNFISLTTSPDTEADLDPGVNVTVYANVTYNYSGIDTVTLQRKLSTAGDYTNQTLVYNSSSGLYEGIFNASDAGTYNLRLVANNTAGNTAISNLVNITVEYEYTWTRTPSVFTTITANLNEEVNLGILTINNTADFSFNFTITSDSNETTFNESTNFTLASGEFKKINVSDNATSSGIKTVTLTINAGDGADPSSQTTLGSIVVAPGQPILVSTFTEPTTESINVIQGDTNVEFTGMLENIGEGNATNVTFYLSYPAGWVITFGSPNLTVGIMESGDTADLPVEFTIPNDFTPGTYVINLAAIGYNESGTNLSDLGLIFDKNLTVTVEAAVQPLGGTGVTTTTPSGGTTGPSGGGGTPNRVEGQEVFNTTEVIKVVRGTSQIVPIGIRNIYSNAAINHLSLELLGFMSQYVTFKPNEIQVIRALETGYFYLDIYVPPYFTDSEYNLTLKLTSNLIPQDPEEAGYYSKRIIEYRTVILKVQEVSKENITAQYEAALKCLGEMKEANFSANKAEDAFALGKKQMDQEYLSQAKEQFAQVCTIRDDAFDAYALLQELLEKVVDAQEENVATPLTQEQIDLAKLAFDRGDFLLSRDRIKEGQLAYALETRSKVKILQFLKSYWYVVAAVLIILSLLFLLLFKRLRRWFVDRRIWLLNEEEKSLLKLIAENHDNYFIKKNLNEMQYHRYSEHYERRLAKIKQIRSSLRVRRVHLMDAEQEKKNLNNEKEQIRLDTKEIQENYLVKRNISKNRYDKEKEALEDRSKEIYREEQLVQERMHTRGSKFLKYVNRVTDIGSKKAKKERSVSKHKKVNR